MTASFFLQPENKDKLVAILAYHVVPAKVMVSDVVKLTDAKTVNGKSVAINVSEGNAMIDLRKC